MIYLFQYFTQITIKACQFFWETNLGCKKHTILLQLSQELQSQNGMRVLVQGVIGGVDIKGPDMQTLLLKRANFLGYKPKSKKNKKDFGYCIFINLVNFGILFPKMFYLKFDNTFYSKTLFSFYHTECPKRSGTPQYILIGWRYLYSYQIYYNVRGLSSK